jgi:biotin transport system ATP-binding protein
LTDEAVFSVRNLVKTFPAGEGVFYALDGVDLDIYRGECLVIAGSNGSGKTLLMRIITGLAGFSGGEVLFEGVPLHGAGRLRLSAGIVFQDADAQIVGETALEDAAFGPRNLGLSRAAAEAAARNALDMVGLTGRENAPARQFSGGEKRRLAVAGVLAMGCETMIFDEPFANLDWPGVQSVFYLLRDLKQAGRTLVILTHELEKILVLADRLVILHRGRVRDTGKPGAVLSRLREEYGVRNPCTRNPCARGAESALWFSGEDAP